MSEQGYDSGTPGPRAILLAGGLGTRLRPYTLRLPKPLVPIGELPIAEVIVKQLANQGFKRVTLAVNHQADLLMEYFGDGQKWDIQIDYAVEPKRLGTMGPLSRITDLPESFLVVNGDVLTDIDYLDLLASHKSSEVAMTVAVASHSVPVDFGVIEAGHDGLVNSFVEKPINSHLVSIGVYAMSSSVSDIIPKETYFGFDDLITHLLSEKWPVRASRFNGFWLDIGRPSDYETAGRLQSNGQLPFFPFSDSDID